MGVEVGGLLGLLVLVGDIWAIVRLVQSPASGIEKILWVVLIVVLPLIGLVVWLIAGPGRP